MSQTLEALAELTSERDRESLEYAFLDLLYRSLPCPAVSLLRIVREPGADAGAALRAEMCRDADGFALCTEPADGAAGLAPQRQRELIAELEGAERGAPVELTLEGGGHRLLLPLWLDRELAGAVELQCDGRVGAADSMRTLQAILRIYANHLGVLDYGERDTLTGLRNRKTFDADFARLHARSDEIADRYRLRGERRQRCAGGEYWLAIADLDHFKRINDEFGHLYGDEVLLLVARLMQSAFRARDRLYRFGGEEFVIVLDCMPEAVAGLPLERFRAAVESHAFPQLKQVTVSIGFTRVGPLDVPATALARADAALYRAKELGRNRVVAYESLPEAQLKPAGPSDDRVELF